MTDVREKAATFAALHVKGQPLRLVNAWDAGSALQLARKGAAAIGTSSASVGWSLGLDDAENVPLEAICANARRMVSAVDLPVTLDFERGYGENAEAVGQSVSEILKCGIVGLNIEDGLPGGKTLRAPADMAMRIAAVRRAGDGAGVPVWINARIDRFLVTAPTEHSQVMEDALARSAAYEQAGADSIFVPGLADLEGIRTFCAACALPVNVMVKDAGADVAALAAAGVARISHGPFPWLHAMAALSDYAGRALA